MTAALVTRAFGNQRGSIVVVVAVMLPVLLTLSALTFSASYAYDKRNQLAAAADAAAKAGALEVWRNGSVTDSELVLFGREEARRQGLNMAGSIVVDVHRCTTAGATCTAPYNTASFVEAIVSETTSTFFGSLIPGTLTPRARAVAGSSASPHCLIALAPVSGTATISIGNSAINMPNCSAVASGNISGANPNAEINAESVAVSGTCSGTCGGFDDLQQNAPPPTDPLASLPVPSNPGGCAATSASSLSAGCYTDITVNNNSTTTLAPGIYYVTGTIDIGNNSSLLGPSGVMLYLAPGAAINFGNHVNLTLSAPTSGTYAGVAFFQDRANGNSFAPGNNATLDITGAFYAPAATVSIANSIGSGSSGCMQLIVYRLSINNGNGALDDASCSELGGSALKSVAMAE